MIITNTVCENGKCYTLMFVAIGTAERLLNCTYCDISGRLESLWHQVGGFDYFDSTNNCICKNCISKLNKNKQDFIIKHNLGIL